MQIDDALSYVANNKQAKCEVDKMFTTEKRPAYFRPEENIEYDRIRGEYDD